MVSDLIEVGQVDLLGNKLVAQQCYQVIVEVGQIDLAGDELESSSAKSQQQLQQQIERDPPSADELRPLTLSDEEGHTTNVGSLLMTEERSNIEALLH